MLVTAVGLVLYLQRRTLHGRRLGVLLGMVGLAAALTVVGATVGPAPGNAVEVAVGPLSIIVLFSVLASWLERSQRRAG